jgi:hypothetical protein
VRIGNERIEFETIEAKETANRDPRCQTKANKKNNAEGHGRPADSEGEEVWYHRFNNNITNKLLRAR